MASRTFLTALDPIISPQTRSRLFQATLHLVRGMDPGNRAYSEYEHPILLIGCPRGGTTLLANIIGAHPRVYIFHERFTRGKQSYLDTFGRYSDLPGFKRSFLQFIPHRVKSSNQRWGIKILTHIWSRDDLERFITAFPQLQIVFVVRDGRDAVLSMLERSQYIKTPSEAYERWMESVEVFTSLKGTTPDRFFWYRYEDLVGDPSTKVAEICRFLNLAFDPGLLDHRRWPGLGSYEIAPITAQRVSKWERQRLPEVTPELTLEFNRALRSMGYGPTSITGDEHREPAARMPRSLRILLVGMGGVNAAFRNWTEPSLAHALVGSGHKVRSYSYLDRSSPVQRLVDEMVDGVRVHRVRLGPVGFSRDLWSAMRNDEPPDIVHIHHLRNELAWQVMLYYRRRGIPVILSPIGMLHDRFITDNRDDPFTSSIKYDNLIFDLPGFLSRLIREMTPRRSLRNWLTHWPLRHADHLIALSEFEKRILMKLGADAGKVSVIPFAVDLELIDRSLAEGKPPRDWPYSRPVILFIGQLKLRKGFDLLIRAAPLVRARFPTASFVFMTHNLSQKDAFMRILDEVGARGFVYLVKQEGGSDTEPEKMRQYAASDIFAFPTRYEGFGIPLLEAMACRVPVVSTKIPVIDEIIQDGETGLLARLNDPQDLAAAIVRALLDADLRRKLASNGRVRVEACYTEPHLAERTVEVYRRLLASPNQV